MTSRVQFGFAEEDDDESDDNDITKTAMSTTTTTTMPTTTMPCSTTTDIVRSRSSATTGNVQAQDMELEVSVWTLGGRWEGEG